jgi:putative addiction module component (TIGR02574 family)
MANLASILIPAAPQRRFAVKSRFCIRIPIGRREVLIMETQLEKLANEALKLTPIERAAFAQLLLASLDQDDEVDDAWAVEVERRIAEVESGTTPVIPMDVALSKVRSALKYSFSSLSGR